MRLRAASKRCVKARRTRIAGCRRALAVLLRESEFLTREKAIPAPAGTLGSDAVGGDSGTSPGPVVAGACNLPVTVTRAAALATEHIDVQSHRGGLLSGRPSRELVDSWSASRSRDALLATRRRCRGLSGAASEVAPVYGCLTTRVSTPSGMHVRDCGHSRRPAAAA